MLVLLCGGSSISKFRIFYCSSVLMTVSLFWLTEGADIQSVIKDKIKIVESSQQHSVTHDLVLHGNYIFTLVSSEQGDHFSNICFSGLSGKSPKFFYFYPPQKNFQTELLVSKVTKNALRLKKIDRFCK